MIQTIYNQETTDRRSIRIFQLFRMVRESHILCYNLPIESYVN